MVTGRKEKVGESRPEPANPLSPSLLYSFLSHGELINLNEQFITQMRASLRSGAFSSILKTFPRRSQSRQEPNEPSLSLDFFSPPKAPRIE